MNKMEEQGVKVSQTLRELATVGVSKDVNDSKELYTEANKLMIDANISNIFVTYDKGDYGFIFMIHSNDPTVGIIVDKKGIPIPASMKSDYKALNLEELFSCYQ